MDLTGWRRSPFWLRWIGYPEYRRLIAIPVHGYFNIGPGEVTEATFKWEYDDGTQATPQTPSL